MEVADDRRCEARVQLGEDRAFEELQLLHPRRARDRDEERPSAQPHRLRATRDLRSDGVGPHPPDRRRAALTGDAIEARLEQLTNGRRRRFRVHARRL